MPEPEFVIYLTTPAIVALDDSLYDPDYSCSLPKQIAVAFVHGSNRAKRVVDILRRHHGGAMFKVEAMPPEDYAPEIRFLRDQTRSAADGGYHRGIRSLARGAIECAEQVGKSPANLLPLEDGDGKEGVDDRTEFESTTSEVAEYLHCSSETVRNRAKDGKAIGERRILKIRDGLYRVVPA